MNTPTAEQHDAYAVWLGELAGLVHTHLMCDLDDLPDAPFDVYFDDGQTPTQTFNICAEQWWDVPPPLHLDEEDHNW